MDLSDWFKGFEKGIARLSSEQRAAFFSECSKNCVDGGVLSIYRKLYKDANGDMDVFFQMADELTGSKKRDCRERSCLSSYFLGIVLVACVKKDMSPHLCFVNVHVRVFFILCKTFGKNRNLE